MDGRKELAAIALALTLSVDGCSGCSGVSIVGDTGAPADALVDPTVDSCVPPDAPADPITWSRTYGTPLDDTALSIAVAPNGDYLIAGTIRDDDAWESEAWLLRLDGEGDPVWANAYAWEARERLSKVRVACNGDILVAGGAAVDLTTGRGGIVARLDPSGAPLWGLGFASDAGSLYMVDRITDVIEMEDGDLVIAGEAGGHLLLARVGADVGVGWQIVLTGSDLDALSMPSLAPAGDGGIAVAAGGVSAERSWTVARLDALGSLLWSRTYSAACAPLYPSARAILMPTPSGGFFVSGEYQLECGYSGFLGMTLDPDGTPLWARSYTSDMWEECSALGAAAIPGGGWVMAGFWRSNDAWIVKVGPGGEQVWNRRYCDCGEYPWGLDEMRAVQIAPDGGLIAAGQTDGFGAIGDDMWVLKTDAEGQVLGSCPPIMGLPADNLPIDVGVPSFPAGLVASDPGLDPVTIEITATPIAPTMATQCSG